MSYSFATRGATLALAVAAAQIEFDKVVAHQPVHAKDREAHFKALDSVAANVTVDPELDVSISMNGSMGWRHVDGGAEPETFTSAGFCCYIGQAVREAPIAG